MKGEEIVERGLIAYCVIMFSAHTMLDIVMDEELDQEKMGKYNG
jgi:hypothetical protein